MSEFRDAAHTLIAALDQLSIAYALGGSIASSLHGIARATQNLDLIVDLPVARVAELHGAICRDFYADEDAMRDAIQRGMAFNVIHLESGLKFDLFIASRHPLGHDQLAHCRKVQTALLGGRIDHAYLDTQAARLGVADLIEGIRWTKVFREIIVGEMAISGERKVSGVQEAI